MNINRTSLIPFLAAKNVAVRFAVGLAGIFMALPAFALQVNVNYSGSQSSSTLVIHVSDENPDFTDSPNIVGSSATTTAFSAGSPHTVNFSLTQGPTYYVWAFLDNGEGGAAAGGFANNGEPDGFEAMGGYGPFPHPGAGLAGANSTTTITLQDRSAISGNVINDSLQSGAVMVEAKTDPFDAAYLRRIELDDYQTGAFVLDGILPSVNNYKVQAFVDKDFDFNPDFDEDKSFDVDVGSFSAGGQLKSGVSVAISSTNSSAQGSSPDHIVLQDEFGGWYQTLPASTDSSKLTVSLRDFNGRLTISSAAVTVNLSVTSPGGLSPPADYKIKMGTNTVTQVVIASGTSSSPPFRFVYLSTVTAPPPVYVSFEAQAVDFPDPNNPIRFAYYDFNVLASGSGFSNLSAVTDSGTSMSALFAISITPDHDGRDDGVKFSATSPDPNGNWELIISRKPFSDNTATNPENVVWRQGGFGSAARGEWYGNDQTRDWRIVPNGDYFARFQTSGGGLTSQTIKITVNTAFIQGRVTKSNNEPIPEADVNVWGPNSGGYARTNSNGNFFVGGLKAGQNYFLNVTKPGFANYSNSNVPAGSSITVTMGSGAVIKVQAQVTGSTSTFDVWGGVFIHNADYTSTAFGPLRIRSGQTVSDNGRWPGTPPAFSDRDPEFSSFTVLGVLPNTAYTVEVELQQFGRVSQSITSPAGDQVSTVTVTVARKANVTGQVQFQSAVNTPYGGEWVSVDGTKKGQSFPTVFGGGFVPNGATSANYNLFGLDNGDYTLRAFSRGFKTQTRSVSISGDRTVNFDPFQEGGKLTGTLTIVGDSSRAGSDSFFGGPGATGGCNPGQVPVFVNAWSPKSFNGSFAQVCITTNTTQTSANFELKGLDDGEYDMFTFLEGFQLDPPVLPIRATVSNGAGRKDITFRNLSGRINLSVGLPGGHDPAKVFYSLQNRGPDRVERSGTLDGNARAVIADLGTGLYELFLRNQNSGLQKRTGVSVTNGKTTEVTVPLDEQTYSITGSVVIQGNISITSNTATSAVTISSVAYLNEKFPPAPLVQAFAFPLPQHFHGENVRPYAEVPVTPANGSFTIGGLVPGMYLIRANNDILKSPSAGTCGPNGCPPSETAFPEFATTQQVVFVDGNVTASTITLTNGAKLTGTISRPDSTTDRREFTVELRRADNLVVWRSTVATSGAGTASYSFSHLSAADYILNVYERIDPFTGRTPKYVSKPQRVTMTTSDATQNITLLEAGAVVGKLRDADSQTLLTSRNAKQFLPDNFGIFAQANPWQPGGFAQAEFDFQKGGISISSVTNQFTIYRLVPDTTYDVNFRGFENFGQQSAARGQKAYAPTVKSGVRVAAGQTVDIGVIDLKQGVSISGKVTDATGNPLPNIQVEGTPSLENGGDRHQFAVQSFTNGEGGYTLQGIDREQLYYDVVAAPRFGAGDIFGRLSGTKYAQETAKMIDVTDADARTSVDFQLTEAKGVVSGRVRTEDGGALELPRFGGEGGEFADRRAVVFLHLEGAPLDDNPLGEIEEVTDVQGNFRIDALKPGTYRMLVVSVGYVTHRQMVIVSGGTTDVGTVTLKKGATAKGTVTKPNGEEPNQSEVSMIVGVDEDFEDFIFGRVSANSDTKTVTGYELSGFRTGVNYFIVIVTENDEILEASSDLIFTASGETKTVNLVYRPPAPAAYVVQSRVGNRYTLRFITTQKVRNLTAAEQAGDSFVTCTACAGTIVSQSISSSRDIITVLYDAAANEKIFKMSLTFTSIQEDADTGTNFVFGPQEYRFFAGAARMRIVQIPNVMGGRAILEGDPTGGVFTSGNFDVSRSSRVEVGVVRAATLDDLVDPSNLAPSAPAAKALGAQTLAQNLGPEAYPAEELYRAVQLAPTVNPFSAFYDIFLPAGVSRSLKKEALLTLQYDSSVTDPSNLNVYYFDEANNVFLLENHKRQIDTKNKTITVAVNHASTFVVLNNNAAIVGANTYTGTEILLHNFPNPFNLKPKTVTLSQPGTASANQTIDGTMIRLALPSNLSGAVKFEIYNVVGELVRTITDSAPTGGAYYYFEWDGKNDGGKKVASGVYIARFTVNGSHERFFKMAVVK
jgi:hypothetical protein